MYIARSILFLLHANVAHGASQDEQGVDPFDLARQLRAEICTTNKSRRNEFYKAKRDEESRDRQLPGIGKRERIVPDRSYRGKKRLSRW